MQPARPSLKVFVEVNNPTRRAISLSRLEYRLTAKGWFDASGRVEVERALEAGGSAVVEIPVFLSKTSSRREQGVPFVLDARLYATENSIERSWDVQAKGALVQDERGVRVGPSIPTQVAGSDD